MNFSLTTIVADTCPSQRVSAVLSEYDFIPKVVIIVDSVSPTAFALLCRAKHAEYRDEVRALQQISNYEYPVQALTEESG